MDFRHLQYIITVAEERSISKAAEKLYIAQPSLSQFVKKVENELQVQIFDRSRNPIELTKEGKIFVERSISILSMYENTKTEILRLSKGIINKVTIGAPFTLSNLLFPDLFNEYKKIDPLVEIVPIESFSQELEELLEKEKIDFAIVNVPFNERKFYSEPVVSEECIFVLPKNYSLVETDIFNQRKCIHVDELNDVPLLLTKSGGIRSIIDHYLRKKNIKPNIIFESRSIDTILSLVNAGIGLSIVPKMLIEREKKWKSLNIDYAFFKEAPPALTLGIAYKKNISISPLVHKTIQMTKKYLINRYN